MDTAFAIGVLTCLFLGAVMLLVPHFSPRRYFFGVTVPPEFRTSEPARKAAREYHAVVASATFVAIALLRADLTLPPLLIVLAASCDYLRERARMRPHAAPSGPARSHVDSGRLPGWVALAVVPYAALLGVAAWLDAHWDEIPARFPIHWDAAGHANGFATKSVRGVYGPLMFGGGISLLLLMLALGTFYGSRPSRVQKAMLGILISATYLMAFAFGTVGLLPLVHIGPAFLLVPILGYAIGVVAWSFKLSSDDPGENTPDAAWTLGGIYYNPADPAIFVQKRFGVGYTVNFGNHRSWIYLGLFAAGLIGIFFLLPR